LLEREFYSLVLYSADQQRKKRDPDLFNRYLKFSSLNFQYRRHSSIPKLSP
jgi:hypothetical protein